jgi:hypothetical protein
MPRRDNCIQTTKNLTLLQYFNEDALFWGIPMICLDLIGVPLFGWGTVLAIAVPATLVAVLAGAVLKHFLVSAQLKQNERRIKASRAGETGTHA